MSRSDPQRVTTTIEGHVLLVALSRPEKHNALDHLALEQLAAAYDHLASEPELRVGVLYAHGRSFCSGLDLEDMLPRLRSEGVAALTGGGRHDPLGVWGPPVPKPIVLAMQGIAWTIAIELALAADVVVAADDVRFRQLEVGRGLLPFGGAVHRATSRLGWSNAMRFLLTADEFGADEARRIGLVQEVVRVGEQLERARAIAHRIAAQAPLGVQATLANARAYGVAAEEAATRHLRGALPGILASRDAAEGLHSFRERREGRFAGR